MPRNNKANGCRKWRTASRTVHRLPAQPAVLHFSCNQNEQPLGTNCSPRLAVHGRKPPRRECPGTTRLTAVGSGGQRLEPFTGCQLNQLSSTSPVTRMSSHLEPTVAPDWPCMV